MESVNNNYLVKHKKFRIDSKKLATLFIITAFIVAIIVFWWLKLVGITVTGEAFCGLDEHTHSDECYISELVCDLDETVSETLPPETESTDESTSAEDGKEAQKEDAVTEETQAQAETTVEAHTHSEACYSKTLKCKTPEHSHNQDCFPDKTADTETVSDWLSTIENIEITNDIPENLIAIAMTQVGYEESKNNFEYDSDGNKNGYTRYGEWYGNPYGKWNAMFVSFCLHYSNINNSDELKAAGAEAMRLAWQNRGVYLSEADHVPERGDIVFIDNDGDGKADSTGVVTSADSDNLVVIMGDSNDKVETVNIKNIDSIIGYGLTSELHFAKDMEYKAESTESGEKIEEGPRSEPPALMMFKAPKANITYINDLTSVVKAVTFKTTEGEIIDNNSTVYLGQTYVISMEFAEKNTGDEWIQFQHDDDHHLYYQIPENLHCEPFTEWHPITAETENGTIENVGEYFIRDDGMLIVVFHDDPVTGECFGAKYSNVAFTIDFNAKVGSSQSGTTTDVVFNEEIKVNFTIDGSATMNVEKTQGEFDRENNTMEYTVKVEAVNGVISDIVLVDKIWEKHYALRDSIVVTDFNGNPIVPQPTVSDNPDGSSGFILSGFPDVPADEGYLIKYKTKLNNDQLGNEVVHLWNEVVVSGKDSDDKVIEKGSSLSSTAYLYKIKKDGKQEAIKDSNGNIISVIRWNVEIIKDKNNLEGTVIIDNLGEGLEYYTGQKIRVDREGADGKKISTVFIDWNDVTIENNSMSFTLPEGHAFNITYYTIHNELSEEQDKEVFKNEVHAYIDGKDESDTGSADVVGFAPVVKKSASGDDGEFVYFTIEADVPAAIKDWGGFFLTDMAAFWGYNENDEGYLYVENVPQDITITAVTPNDTITFKPYVPGEATENTYIFVAPAGGNQHHSFNIFFNTSVANSASSKWILNEDAKLKITYKLPFDAKTGVEWTGELQGDKVLEDVLLEKYTLYNEAYLNFTSFIDGTASTTYTYTPKITKHSEANDDGTIDYTVTFYNSIPGSQGPLGYVYSSKSVVFTDTFDERLEYVPGSLSVVGYSPWSDSTWFNKYVYNGSVSGNKISINSTELLYAETNQTLEADMLAWLRDWMPNYQVYCNSISGGRHVFTYKLRLKDEYLYTTEENKYELDNTAELLWDGDNTSGPAKETTEYKTGLIDKHVVQENNKLLFDIHINRNALDILKGADTLTIEDTMTHNLSVYWNSIKLLYQDKTTGDWIDFDSENSQYKYTVTYDQTSNKLTFVVPDQLHIRIDYSTLITESGQVSVNNAVKVDGKAQVSDFVDATFKVEDHSGGASGSMHEITLIKQDGDTDERLPDVTFLLYGPMPDSSAVLPDGAAESIVTDSGKVLGYIGSYTTGADGTVLIKTQYLTIGGPYALVEATPPSGYNALEKPVYFYFYEPDPNGILQTVTTLIAVENYTYGFALPETGGTGTLPLAIIGISLMAFPVLYSIIRRKRERRFS
ncbi:MAG: SpaA isopeptide-forming pilin-related protein [Acutalibacteraceae bacterium]|nr:SpaA isopeptide-forming pilin-related protein [Acutalibacteraceae bacterium]